MARITKMLWSNEADPNNLDAAGKAVTDAFVDGLEVDIPKRATNVGIDVVVVTKGATATLYLKLSSSSNKAYWAKSTFYDSPTIAATEIEIAAKDMVISISDIADGFARRLKHDISDSDYLKTELKGDAAGAVVKIFATFFEPDRD